MRFNDRGRISVALLYGALAILAYAMFLIIQPFWSPLGWACVLAIVFHPVYAKLERRWGSTRAATLATIVLTVAVIVPILLLTIAFVREAVQAVGDIQRAFAEGRLAWIDRAWGWLQRRSRGALQGNVTAAAVNMARQFASGLAAQAGNVLQNAAAFVFNLFLTLFATFFLLRDSKAIMQTVRRLLPLDEPGRERLIRQTHDLIFVSVTSALIVAGLQGALGGLLFAALGIDAPVFWGVVMGFFCLLPFGAWVVWLPAAIALFAAGDVLRGTIMAGVGLAVVSAVDNVLRPALLSGRARVNGLLMFISLIGGIGVFGSLGLVLGPTLVATVVGIVKSYAAGQDRARPTP